MSAVQTKQYIKNPLYVDAVRVTEKNFKDVSKWCRGRVRTERTDALQNAGEQYIKVEAHNPINTRQTKAFVGDWMLKTDRGFKIYSHKAFTESFTESKNYAPQGVDRSVEAQVQDEMEKTV